MQSSERDLFFATSFSGHVDYETGEVQADFRERLEDILSALREIGGFTVYCAAEAENWRISQQEPGVSMATNFMHIEARPLFLALVDSAGSDGRGVEVEHAHNKGKKVFLATGPGESLSWVMNENVALGRAQHIAYESPRDLAEALRQRTEGIYQKAELTIEDFGETGRSRANTKKMWKYLMNFADTHEDFPLRPINSWTELEGDLGAVAEWIEARCPRLAKLETFKLLEKIKLSRTEQHD